MENQESSAETPLRNIIKRAGSETTYDTVPEGPRVMGLVEIKMAQKTSSKTKQKEDCYRFVFRDRDLNNGFVNVSVWPKWGAEKCGLYLLLSPMTDYAITLTATEEEVFETMTGLIGRWFRLPVVHRPNPKDQKRPYCNIRDGAQPTLVTTITENALEYFKAKDEAAKDDIPF